MALTATATQGLEFYRYVQEHEVLYIPGDPGDTFTRGDAVTTTVGEGILDPAVADEMIVGTVAKTTTCAAASVAFPKPGSFNPAHDTSDTLIPIHSAVPAGTPIYLATFASQADETVVSYTASTRAIAETTGHTADDYPNGALVCFYEGPSIGEVNVVEDYDHTGGAAELLLILHRKCAGTPTTSTKFIVLAGEAAGSRGMGFFNRIDLADANNLATNDGADLGKFMIYMDWRDSYRFLSNLKVPIIRTSAMQLA